MIIYKITNKITKKFYIGKTERTLFARWKAHCRDALHNKSKTYFHRSIRKHGAHNFACKIIMRADNIDKLNKLEEHFISKWNSTESKIGYNGTSGGDGGVPNKQSRRKISQALSGRPKPPITEEHRRNLSEANKGQKRTKEQIIKMSKALKGRVFSDEHKRNIGKVTRGKKQAKEHVRKRVESRAEYKHSDETKRKISEARLKIIRNNR